MLPLLSLLGCAVAALPLLYFTVTYIMHLMDLKNYPSGAFPLPIVGNSRQLSENMHLVLSKWAKKYGDVFSVSFGMHRNVIISAYEPAIEALASEAFAGRERSHESLKMITLGHKGMALSDYGKRFSFMRKIEQTHLRTHREGINIDEMIVKESNELEKRLDEANETPVDVKEQFSLAVINVINLLLFSERFEIDDEDYKIALKIGRIILDSAKNNEPTLILYWTKFLPINRFKLLKEMLQLRESFMSKRILQHESTIDVTKKRDLTDDLIDISRNKEKLRKHGMEDMGYDDIVAMLSEMFTGGFETTSSTLGWAVLYLIHWPKYQEEIYQEMIQYLGENKKPTLEDRQGLHLLEATVQETLRLAHGGTLGFPHKTLKDTIIAGKFIPKGTTVHFNLWNIAHDEKYWDQPDEFLPHRWLDEDGKYSPRKHKNFIPFSAGKRVCIGEAMARKQMFLFLARILYEFEILPNPDEPFPSLDTEYSIVLFHKPYKAIFKRRNKCEQ